MHSVTSRAVRLGILFVATCGGAYAAEQTVAFEDPTAFDTVNRKLTLDPSGVAYVNAAAGEGVAWLRDVGFGEGRISLDVKGADRPGQSFVGLAFHGDRERGAFDVIYVRPFNFQAADAQRRAHALQYMSLPDAPWQQLREQFPGKYEAEVSPAPSPDAWVRITAEVRAGTARFFINDAKTPSLVVDLLNKSTGEAIGLWVGNNSDGHFRKLRIESMGSQ